MILAATLVIIGVFLSAFFSGSETGFYRVTRVRLLLDAKSGRLFPQALLWLIERPSLVVATVLIGNNIANYLVSLGLVMLTTGWLVGWGVWLDTAMPILATPLLFIYGELLPKHLYFHAPYLLSSRGAPLMVLFAGLFLPLSALVMLLENVWRRFMQGTDTQSNISLERQELQRVLLESQEAGIVLPVQRELAQNLFTYGVKPIRQFAGPARSVPTIVHQTDSQALLAQAKSTSQKYIAQLDDHDAALSHCFLVSDLLLFPDQPPMALPVYKAEASESSINVLSQMQSTNSPLAEVRDAKGKLLGIVGRDRLTRLLLDAR